MYIAHRPNIGSVEQTKERKNMDKQTLKVAKKQYANDKHYSFVEVEEGRYVIIDTRDYVVYDAHLLHNVYDSKSLKDATVELRRKTVKSGKVITIIKERNKMKKQNKLVKELIVNRIMLRDISVPSIAKQLIEKYEITMDELDIAYNKAGDKISKFLAAR